MADMVKFLKSEKARLYRESGSEKPFMELLWGDRVEVISRTAVNGRIEVNARWARNAWIDPDELGDTALLELYFIDVGQGDGILIVTPDRKHILIDGGYRRRKQPHGKSAADFVDWKFKKDYRMDNIELNAMLNTHCDADHYGGLWDLLDEKQKKDLDTNSLSVGKFYHSGISWWSSADNERFLGRKKDGGMEDLLTDAQSIRKGLDKNSSLKLQGEWAKFMKNIITYTDEIERLSYNPEKDFSWLEGFGKDDPVSIKVLGPVEKTVEGKPVLKDFGEDSQNTNGNSVLLRIDYKKSRMLLTGDLNKNSQQYILDSFRGKEEELAADVLKACHHGSDDCSYEFLKSVQAGATVFSSGDEETNGHPRPNIVAASGVTGFRKIEDDEMITPLIYSTEISRSIRLGDPYEVSYKDFEIPGADPMDLSLTNEKRTTIAYKRTASGAMNPEDKSSAMNRLKVVDGIIYGLVNIRTDGDKILCATMNEGKSTWDIRTFRSRF